jgi:hypothetical protein
VISYQLSELNAIFRLSFGVRLISRIDGIEDRHAFLPRVFSNCEFFGGFLYSVHPFASSD